jgi:hypothetical protein
MVARRTSCFSCGHVQAESGSFCSACGKSLAAPDLEFISASNSDSPGNDVVMGTGGRNVRSAVVIVAVFVALAGAIAFSGKRSITTAATSPTTKGVRRSSTSSSPESSTRTSVLRKASSSTTSMVRTPTSVPIDISTTSTTLKAPPTTTTPASAGTTGPAGPTAGPTAGPASGPAISLSVPPLRRPRTLATPILPEKTGAKLLLNSMSVPGGGLLEDAVVDLDSGVVTSYPSGSRRSVVQAYGSGVLITDMSYGGLAFDIWQPTGPTQTVTVLPDSVDIYQPPGVLAGDVFWLMYRNAITPGEEVGRLVGYDVHNGHKVVDEKLRGLTRLIGSDAANNPVVVDYRSGTYSVDPATQQFTLITKNIAYLARGDWLVERACTEQIVCGVAVLHGTDLPRPVPDLAVLDEPVSLSPNGQTLIQTVPGDGGFLALEAVDLITGTRQKLDLDADMEIISLSWSADSQWLFGLRYGVLSAWKVGSTQIVPLAFDGEPVRVANFAIFPS